METKPLDNRLFTLTVKDGLVGQTRFQGYEVPRGTTGALSLPLKKGGAGPYELAVAGQTVKLIPVKAESNLSRMEMTSRLRSVLSSNMLLIAVLVAGLILQVLFYGMLISRALMVRRRKRLQLSKPAMDKPAYTMRRGTGSVKLLKIEALLLTAISLTVLALSALLFFSWLRETDNIGQIAIQWYATLYLLPYVLLLVLSGIPSLLAGLHAFFWKGGLYRLRTGRLFALFALVFALIQLFFVTSLENTMMDGLMVLLTLAQCLLLLAIFLFGNRCLKKEKHHSLAVAKEAGETA